MATIELKGIRFGDLCREILVANAALGLLLDAEMHCCDSCYSFFVNFGLYFAFKVLIVTLQTSPAKSPISPHKFNPTVVSLQKDTEEKGVS